MDLILPSVTSLNELNSSVISKVERCARVAYKSTSKMVPGIITDNTRNILNMMLSNKHLSVLSQVSIIVYFKHKTSASYIRELNPNYLSKVMCISCMDGPIYAVKGNLRAWYELLVNPYDYILYPFTDKYNALSSLFERFECAFGELFTNPDALAAKDKVVLTDNWDRELILIEVDPDWYTYEITTDIGVGKEWFRHTSLHGTQESTRYVNYSTKGLKICLPVPFTWAKLSASMSKDDKAKYKEWFVAMKNAEKSYNKLINLGCTPQEARSVLPHSTATTFVMSGDIKSWKHFLILRYNAKAQPQIMAVAKQVFVDLNEQGVFDDDPKFLERIRDASKDIKYD